MTVKIKICGVTGVSDAAAVVAAGADALGLNFVPASPRCLSAERAGEIARAVAGRLQRVGVFADATAADVDAVLAQVPLDALQFHGAESGAFCRGFGLPYLKVFRVREPLPLDALEGEYGDACCWLLDAWSRQGLGGTGERFDWSLWPEGARRPLVLAGGLRPDNVAAAVRRLSPWGVDVSSGVEEPGQEAPRKDAAKIQRFVDEVRSARQ